VHINNTFQNANHPKSILAQLKAAEGLPFKEILASGKIAKNISQCHFRDRFYSLDITMWGFLSQVLNDDKSCQAAVARVIAFFSNQGKKPPSANTTAYSKARSRLSETIISNLTKESAKKLEEQVPSNWLWRNRQIKLVDGSTL
jgi:hypothetical protein